MKRFAIILLCLCSIASGQTIIENDADSNITYFIIRTASDGTATTGATATSFDLTYTEQGATAVKADATLNGNGVGGAWSDTTVIEVDATNSPGLYRVDWPNIAFDGGIGKTVVLSVKLASSFTEHLLVQLSPPTNPTAWNDTTLPADVQAGYPTVTIKDGTGTGEIDTLSGSIVNVDLVDLATTTTTATTATNVTTVSAGGITASSIATDAIGAAEIAADAIGASEIATDALTATEIAADAIGAAEAGFLTDSTGFQGADIAAILTDTGTTLDAHLTDIKGTAFVKDTHSLIDIEGYVDILDDGTSGNVKIATDVAAILVDTAVIGAAGVGLTSVALADATSDAVMADAVWNALTASYGGVGSYGEHVESLSAGGDATATNQTTILAKMLAYTRLTLRSDAGPTTDDATELTAINADDGAGAGDYAAGDSQEGILDRGNAAWITGGAGSGAITYTYTITDTGAGNPIADVLVWVTTDLAGTNTIGTTRTDNFGEAVFTLDAGTYYIWRKKGGVQFTNPDSDVVN